MPIDKRSAVIGHLTCTEVELESDTEGEKEGLARVHMEID
jgi:hypothetical protein